MPPKGARALQEHLGAKPPAGLVKALDDAEAGALALTIEAARRRQREALDEAIAHGFGFVPRLLRGTVKRIVGA